MALVEIEEGTLQALQGAHRLMDGLMKDPKTRPYTEKLIKAKYPSVTTSEDDPRVKEMRALAKEMRDFKTEQENEKISAKLDKSFDAVRDEYGFTDEGMDEIKKLMVSEKIPNPEAAAAYWAKKNPPKVQEPSGYSPEDWGFGQETDDQDLKELWQSDSNDKWLYKEIGRTLKDFRKHGED